MKMTALKDITLTGELAFRIGWNYSRLEAPLYRPESIFQADQQGWPGDWEGRTILALSFHEDITGRKAAWLDDILEALEAQWNPQGYLKEICLPDWVDEQQLSGHNWLLRGLLELYIRRQEEKFVRRAKTIVENLYLPLRGRFEGYPTENRAPQGAAAGHIASGANGWRLSTDVGCAFLSFDALAQYYGLFGGDPLRALLWEMFETFRRIDPVDCRLQTHATLSALRGILRFYETEGDPVLLEFVQDRFDLYLKAGMTANYANYNWFGRPLWTEPCAVVDSHMVAVHLFRHTRQGRYMALANQIYYNALLAAQRPNGGFGCDNCLGAGGQRVLRWAEGAYEAYWCCSMRGAEGLSFAAASAVLTERDRITITNYVPGTYRLGDLTLTIRSRYPRENRLLLCLDGLTRRKDLRLYVPEGALDVQVLVNGACQRAPLQDGFLSVVMEGSGEVEVSFRLEDRIAASAGILLTRRGDLILGRSHRGRDFLCDRMYLHEHENELTLDLKD